MATGFPVAVRIPTVAEGTIRLQCSLLRSHGKCRNSSAVRSILPYPRRSVDGCLKARDSGDSTRFCRFPPSRVSLLPRDRRRAGRFRQSARLDLDHRCGRLRASSVRDFPNSCAIQGQKTVMDHSSESASEAAETTLRKGRLSRFHFPKRLILARKARLTAGITRFYIAAYTEAAIAGVLQILGGLPAMPYSVQLPLNTKQQGIQASDSPMRLVPH